MMQQFAFFVAVNTYVDFAARRTLLFEIKMRFGIFTRDINRLNKLVDIVVNSIWKWSFFCRKRAIRRV